MKRYRLRQGNLREHESGEWVAAAEAEAALQRRVDSYECLRRHANLETDHVEQLRKRVAELEATLDILLHPNQPPRGGGTGPVYRAGTGPCAAEAGGEG